MIVLPGFLTVPTRVPEVGLFGGVFPFAALTSTPANELAVGLTHESATDDAVTFVVLTEVTGPSASAVALAATGDHSTSPRATATTQAPARARRRGVIIPVRSAAIADRSAGHDCLGGRDG